MASGFRGRAAVIRGQRLARTIRSRRRRDRQRWARGIALSLRFQLLDEGRQHIAHRRDAIDHALVRRGDEIADAGEEAHAILERTRPVGRGPTSRLARSPPAGVAAAATHLSARWRRCAPLRRAPARRRSGAAAAEWLRQGRLRSPQPLIGAGVFSAATWRARRAPGNRRWDSPASLSCGAGQPRRRAVRPARRTARAPRGARRKQRRRRSKAAARTSGTRFCVMARNPLRSIGGICAASGPPDGSLNDGLKFTSVRGEFMSQRGDVSLFSAGASLGSRRSLLAMLGESATSSAPSLRLIVRGSSLEFTTR